jgi:hypothetical protein
MNFSSSSVGNAGRLTGESHGENVGASFLASCSSIPFSNFACKSGESSSHQEPANSPWEMILNSNSN